MIRAEHVVFSYGRTQVLRDVSVRAEPGRITALLGPNASGKSTLLRCLIGALKPGAGEVLLKGRSINELSPRQIAARIAYVPQRSIVSAAFSVKQVVELGRYALSANARAVDDAIARMQLHGLEDRPYPRLSVGQQQRVTLARALAQIGAVGDEPCDRILILDEPTSAMDLQHIATTMCLLRELANKGVTVIVAMHDISLAAAIADDAWLLNDGQCTAAGPAGEVLTIDRLQNVFQVEFETVTTSRGVLPVWRGFAEIAKI